VNDITAEALGEKLFDNPDGLLCSCDELAGWAGSMDAYRPGKAVSKDQGFWLSAKGGGSYTVDRVTRGTLAIAVNAVHVLGNIQPDVIRRLAPDWGGNGLMQRFLIVIAKPAAPAIDRAPDRDAAETFANAIRRLTELEHNSFVPVFRFSAEADEYRQRLVSFAGSLIAQPDTPKPLAGWLEKLEGEWARLCLVFHCFEWATNDAKGAFPPEIISADTAACAARFLVEFQYPHQVAFYRSVAGLAAATQSNAQWVAGHILHHGLSEISERDIERAHRDVRGSDKRTARLETTQRLEGTGWLQPAGTHRSGSHTNRWKVNPAVHTLFIGRAAAEHERREEAKRSIERAAEAKRRILANQPHWGRSDA
jgi:hypothetical protein